MSPPPHYQIAVSRKPSIILFKTQHYHNPSLLSFPQCHFIEKSLNRLKSCHKLPADLQVCCHRTAAGKGMPESRVSQPFTEAGVTQKPLQDCLSRGCALRAAPPASHPLSGAGGRQGPVCVCGQSRLSKGWRSFHRAGASLVPRWFSGLLLSCQVGALVIFTRRVCLIYIPTSKRPKSSCSRLL